MQGKAKICKKMKKVEKQEEKELIPFSEISMMAGRWGGCGNCPTGEFCERMANMSEKEQQKGCGDIRQLQRETLSLYQRPEQVLALTLADIETRIQLQSLKDGKQLSTKSFAALMKMKKNFLEMVFKYGKGTVHTQIQINADRLPDVIPVAEDSYQAADAGDEEGSGDNGGESGADSEAGSETG